MFRSECNYKSVHILSANHQLKIHVLGGVKICMLSLDKINKIFALCLKKVHTLLQIHLMLAVF